MEPETVTLVVGSDADERTQLGLRAAWTTATAGVPALVIAAGLTTQDLMIRTMSLARGEAHQDVMTVAATRAALWEAEVMLQRLPLFYDTDADSCEGVVLATVKARLTANGPLGLVVIDGADVMSGDGPWMNHARDLAKAVRCPVVATTSHARPAADEYDTLVVLEGSARDTRATVCGHPSPGIISPIPRVDGADALLGWKLWELRENTLLSPLRGTVWPRGVFVAECDHGRPSRHCRCGTYAFGDLPSALDARRDTHVLGVVRGWGRVVRHEFGFRAQYTQPIQLYLRQHQHSSRRRLIEQYECDADVIEAIPAQLPCRMFTSVADTASEVRRVTDIVDLIGDRVALRQLAPGSSWVGQCPFHEDRSSASLTVNGGKGLYHCSSCKAGGDVITFTLATEPVGFREAVARLAIRSGIISTVTSYAKSGAQQAS